MVRSKSPHITTFHLTCPPNINSAHLGLYLSMARKGKPLGDATCLAIIRMFHSGYNKKDIMRALDIGEQSLWQILKQWRTNQHFCRHLTRETQGRPWKMGIMESSVCSCCISCKGWLVNHDLVPRAQNYFYTWYLFWCAPERSAGWEGFMCWCCNYLVSTSTTWLHPQVSKYELTCYSGILLTIAQVNKAAQEQSLFQRAIYIPSLQIDLLGTSRSIVPSPV